VVTALKSHGTFHPESSHCSRQEHPTLVWQIRAVRAVGAGHNFYLLASSSSWGGNETGARLQMFPVPNTMAGEADV